MVNILDIRDIQHLNLFSKITGISTRFCFMYNETIIFAVPKNFVSKAIGESGKNVRRINEIIHKKIKILASPKGIEDAGRFIKDVVSPVNFNKMEIKENEIIITAGSQNKAALLGRNKRRLLELQKIVKDFFKKDLRIV